MSARVEAKRRGQATRRMPTFVLVLSLATATVTTVASAPAQAQAATSNEGRAREAMQAGITAFGRGDAEGALREYERAKLLVPAANLPYRYAAEALLSLGRPREAMENLRTYLEKNPSVSDAEAVRGRIAALEAKLSRGDLGVRATGPGATLRIDGNEPHLLPHEASLPAGEHTLVVECEGYARLEQRVTVTAGKRDDLVLSLVPLSQPPKVAPAPVPPRLSETTTPPTVWPTVGAFGLGLGAVGLVTVIVLDATALGSKMDSLESASRAGDPRVGEIQNETVSLRTGLQVGYVASIVTLAAGAAVLLFAPHYVVRSDKANRDAQSSPFVFRF